MPRPKKTKSSFNRDDQGRVVLGSAKEMAEWVKLGFEEQDKNKIPEIPFEKHFIDFRDCVLYVSYPIGSKEPVSKIFNLCDLAGIVPGMEKIENDPKYLFEVTLDIHFNNSVLYGNFFHYVKFDGRVSMDRTIIKGINSCVGCHFEEFVFLQNTQFEGGYYFDQCEFKKGLMMSGATAKSIEARIHYCSINERLSLVDASFVNQRHTNYQQVIDISNSTIENLDISKISTNEIPFFIKDSTIHGMKMDDVSMNGPLIYESCSLNGIFTAVVNKNSTNNKIKELNFHCCNLNAQYHIEKSDIDTIAFYFGNISSVGRLRISECDLGALQVVSSSVFGQMDIISSSITTVSFEETCVQGYLLFQDNTVKDFADRQTVRLLKNEALKVNDRVAATHHYAIEMQKLLAEKGIPCEDRISLRLAQWFSKFGECWIKALIVTLFLSVVLTLIMLGFGSSKYAFTPSGEFMGWGSFLTSLLDSINVFSIPLFKDTVEEYGLNTIGQFIYFIIKIVVAYGTYQFVLAFRKHSRS